MAPSSDGQVLLYIAIAIALFVAGRKFQLMLNAWRDWRKAVASIPKLRSTAWGGVGTMFRVGMIAALVFVVAAMVNRHI
ncbi:hypothetical protein Pth03_46200 [Planotetraspora thailandica]|uniref:Uncharacterized protein n=1 Tax=Planotetraspora thailandica TaxID=487172 RepID=A0A8J3V3P3_9ACTN|nr:hypothetical protein [Planotetraspora thailandica]GII56231.1 hypothetical protein Pth03_46200 [Planotetraspora thailandica]